MREDRLDEAAEFVPDAPDAVRELADHVITRTERLLNYENCYGEGITEALEKAQDLHLAACQAGTPDPQALAERLATGALQSGWGVFRDGPANYARMLGAGEYLLEIGGFFGCIDDELVQPVVAEVVPVLDNAAGLHKVAEAETCARRACRICSPDPACILAVGDPEVVQVALPPAHRLLDHPVRPRHALDAADRVPAQAGELHRGLVTTVRSG